MPKKSPKTVAVVKEEPKEEEPMPALEAAPEQPVQTPKPRRAKSAWLNYYSFYYAHNKPKEGKIKVTEICREAASKWGGFTDEQKATWKTPPGSM